MFISAFICFGKGFSIILEILGKTLTVLQFSLFNGSFFLKTGVISASFILLGKLSVIKHSLRIFCQVSAEILQLIFNILGGIVFLVFVFEYVLKRKKLLIYQITFSKVSLQHVYSIMVRKNFQIYGVQNPKKCTFKSKNWINRFLFMPPIQTSLLGPASIIIRKAEGNCSYPPGIVFLKTIFPAAEREWEAREETLIYLIKIQFEYMTMTCNISLIVFQLICNCFKYNDFF